MADALEDEAVMYNRTFVEYVNLADGPDHCPKSTDNRQRPLDTFAAWERLRPTYRTLMTPLDLGPPPPRLRPRFDPYGPGYAGPHIYDAVGTDLSPIEITDKPDQDFAAYATPWERDNSTLCGGQDARFTPVVNRPERLVVGHYATAPGDRLIAPADTLIFNDVNGTLKKGPVFYCPDARPPAGWAWLATADVVYAIVTTIDGEVIGAQAVANPSARATDFFLLDIVLAGQLVTDLGLGLGRQLVTSLVRRSLRRGVLAGVTEAVKEAKSIAAFRANTSAGESETESRHRPRRPAALAGRASDG